MPGIGASVEVGLSTCLNVTCMLIMLLAPCPEVIATGCSGSGAPSLALEELVGKHNFTEVVSSEIHAPCMNSLSAAWVSGVE